jgi:hypothetical protein
MHLAQYFDVTPFAADAGSHLSTVSGLKPMMSSVKPADKIFLRPALIAR